MLDAFRDHAFRGHTSSLVAAPGFSTSALRAAGSRKIEREYQKIIRLLTDAREAGLFDCDAIEDRGREVVMRPCWRSLAEMLKTAASSYHEDRWELQDVRVVVVLEKAALTGIVEPHHHFILPPLPAGKQRLVNPLSP